MPRVPATRRPLMLIGITVRLLGVAMLGYAVPLVWHRLAHPGWGLAAAAVVAAQGVAVVAWWLRRGEIVHGTVFSDLPLGAGALLFGPLLVAPGAGPGWSLFALPYTIFVSYTCGLICRTLPGSVGVGATWAGSAVAGAVAFGTVTTGGSLAVVSALLLLPGLGWLSASALWRAALELEQAQAVAVRETAELAAARERARHEAALHDRVLQTLEMLGRCDVVTADDLRSRVQAQASWLRRYVETGRADEDADLASRLAHAALAARPGVAVEVNDAGLMAEASSAALGAAQQDAIVRATRRAVEVVSGVAPRVVVRVAGRDGGLLVTVLGTDVTEPAPFDLDDVRPWFTVAGGAISVEPTPYVELRMPAAGPVDDRR
jgi:hypothetical protein